MTASGSNGRKIGNQADRASDHRLTRRPNPDSNLGAWFYAKETPECASIKDQPEPKRP